MKFTRDDRSALSEWWFSVDRVLLGAALTLMLLGFVLAIAASPAAARRYGEMEMFFVQRHALFLIPAVLAVIAASFATPGVVRGLGAVLFAGGLVLVVAALLQGHEKNGAVRWLDLGPLAIQPSEFVKPGLVILTAWAFSAGGAQRVPPLALAAGSLALTVAAFVAQPDFGQTVLIVAVWGGLFFLAGYSLVWIGAGVLAAAGGLVAAYAGLPHVARRIDGFFDPSAGDSRQVELALEAFRRGGWWGAGPGEGTVKLALPDSHTDYVFAVIGEEYGIAVCLVLAALYGIIVWRIAAAGLRHPESFARLALAGLALLLGGQALVNMAVNVGLLPAKGMTLPFVSYGGSSMAASGLSLGLALSLSRKRPMPRRDALAEADAPPATLWTLRA